MKAFLLLLAVLLLAAASAVQAASVKDAVRSALEAGLAAEAEVAVAADAEAEAEGEAEVDVDVEGIQNCPNKCQNLLNNQAFMVQQTNTYEYVACLAGCQICQAIQTNNDTATSCSTVCKNTDWNKMIDPSTNQPMTVQKGVIEPDKACIMGCIINLCQEVCQGGTTDMNPSPTNMPSWWGYGGCSIKTGGVRPGGYYSQNSQYNYANNPAGSGGQDDCCANAYSLCNYNALFGPTDTNQANVLSMAQKWCGDVPGLTPSSDKDAICAFFKSSCGSNVVGR